MDEDNIVQIYQQEPNVVLVAGGLQGPAGAGGTTRKFTQTFGDNAANSFVITHNLNTLDVVVNVFHIQTGVNQTCTVQRSSANTITLVFGLAPTVDAMKIVVVG